MNSEVYTKQEAMKHVTSISLATAIYRMLEDIHTSSNIVKNLKGVKCKVADFGCGNGEYLSLFDAVHNEGDSSFEWDFKNTYGVEGTAELVLQSWNQIYHPVDLGCKDLDFETAHGKGHVLCLEVAEHIHGNRHGNFLDNITKHVARDHFLILSWAIRGQGGLRHVSCRNEEEVIPMIEQRSFKFLRVLSQMLRNEGANDFWWFKKSIYVFRKL